MCPIPTLHGVNHPDQIESSLHKHALRGRPDGVLFFSMNLPDALMREAKRLNIPTAEFESVMEESDKTPIQLRLDERLSIELDRGFDPPSLRNAIDALCGKASCWR